MNDGDYGRQSPLILQEKVPSSQSFDSSSSSSLLNDPSFNLHGISEGFGSSSSSSSMRLLPTCGDGSNGPSEFLRRIRKKSTTWLPILVAVKGEEGSRGGINSEDWKAFSVLSSSMLRMLTFSVCAARKFGGMRSELVLDRANCC